VGTITHSEGVEGMTQGTCSAVHTIQGNSQRRIQHGRACSKTLSITSQAAYYGSIILDEDFVMILLTSLPELWENYVSSLLGSHGNQPTLKSQELVGVLIEEDRHRKECAGGDYITGQRECWQGDITRE
jgi:hypothetical protein